jgi:hypothetical protein
MSKNDVIETTAGKAGTELARLGMSYDERVTVTISINEN